ncbi:MAG: hypothetical protein F6K10_01320, partial [Moorea sp. SIO2B7]|nr:hypothetical protein [Moorena sp. SIO2B7]
MPEESVSETLPEDLSEKSSIIEIPSTTDTEILELESDGEISLPSLSPRKIPRFDIVEAQEQTRSILAYCLLGLLMLTLVGVGL